MRVTERTLRQVTRAAERLSIPGSIQFPVSRQWKKAEGTRREPVLVFPKGSYSSAVGGAFCKFTGNDPFAENDFSDLMLNTHSPGERAVLEFRENRPAEYNSFRVVMLKVLSELLWHLKEEPDLPQDIEAILRKTFHNTWEAVDSHYQGESSKVEEGLETFLNCLKDVQAQGLPRKRNYKGTMSASFDDSGILKITVSPKRRFKGSAAKINISDGESKLPLFRAYVKFVFNKNDKHVFGSSLVPIELNEKSRSGSVEIDYSSHSPAKSFIAEVSLLQPGSSDFLTDVVVIEKDKL